MSIWTGGAIGAAGGGGIGAVFDGTATGCGTGCAAAAVAVSLSSAASVWRDALCMKPIDTSAASIAAVAMRIIAVAERSRAEVGRVAGRRVDAVISLGLLGGTHPLRSSHDGIGGRTEDGGGTEYITGRIADGGT